MKKFAITAALLLSVVGAHAADIVGNPIAARDKVAMCIGCHGIPGYRTAYPEVYHVPMLGGQNAQYIENALKEYKTRQRKFQTMHAVAASLSDQDIADIATYYAEQTSASKPNPVK
ncbi:MAG: c-type cytochrome [Janthinobacterium lividum]